MARPANQIASLAVDTAQLAADAVDGTKIEDDAVDSEHLAAGSIDAEHLAANSIDSASYVDDSIDAEHFADPMIKYTAVGTIAATAVDTLAASPVDLLAAPAAGYVTVFHGLYLNIYGGTADYTNAQNLIVKDETGNSLSGTLTNFLSGSTYGACAFLAPATGLVVTAEKLQLTCSDDVATGDRNLKFVLFYSTLPVDATGA